MNVLLFWKTSKLLGVQIFWLVTETRRMNKIRYINDCITITGSLVYMRLYYLFGGLSHFLQYQIIIYVKSSDDIYELHIFSI